MNNKNNKPTTADSLKALQSMSLDILGSSAEVAAKTLYAIKENPTTVAAGIGSAMLLNRGIEDDSAILTGLGVAGAIYTATKLPEVIKDFKDFNSLEFNQGLLDLEAPAETAEEK